MSGPSPCVNIADITERHEEDKARSTDLIEYVRPMNEGGYYVQWLQATLTVAGTWQYFLSRFASTVAFFSLSIYDA